MNQILINDKIKIIFFLLIKCNKNKTLNIDLINYIMMRINKSIILLKMVLRSILEIKKKLRSILKVNIKNL